MRSEQLIEAVEQVVGAEHVERDVLLGDASGLSGTAAVLARPGDAEQVRALVAVGVRP